MASLAASAAVGCGGDGSRYTIDDGPLAGLFNGTDWKFVSGDTNDSLSDENGYFATLHDTEITSCSGSAGEGEAIVLVNIPKEVGTYDFDLDQGLTFVLERKEVVSFTGVIEVESVTDTKVSAGLHAVYNNDPNFEISGHFEVDICPPDGT